MLACLDTIGDAYWGAVRVSRYLVILVIRFPPCGRMAGDESGITKSSPRYTCFRCLGQIPGEILRVEPLSAEGWMHLEEGFLASWDKLSQCPDPGAGLRLSALRNSVSELIGLGVTRGPRSRSHI